MVHNPANMVSRVHHLGTHRELAARLLDDDALVQQLLRDRAAVLRARVQR